MTATYQLLPLKTRLLLRSDFLPTYSPSVNAPSFDTSSLLYAHECH